jgi:hypothetical protein
MIEKSSIIEPSRSFGTVFCATGFKSSSNWTTLKPSSLLISSLMNKTPHLTAFYYKSKSTGTFLYRYCKYTECVQQAFFL